MFTLDCGRKSVATTLLALGAAVGAAASIAANADEIGPLHPHERAKEAYELRVNAAAGNLRSRLPAHPVNNDESRYVDRMNSYTKGLPHDANGIVVPSAYNALYRALSTGRNGDFEAIPLGVPNGNKLRNPQSAYAYLFEGRDPHSFTMPAAPAFASAWQAADAAEVLWQALTRDVPFAQYGSDLVIAQAVTDMSHYSDYRGPRRNRQVSADSLFRGVGVGETVGPYISQFLLLSVPYGATSIEQKYNIPTANSDYLTNWNDWLLIQNGGTLNVTAPATAPRYLFGGRALAQYVLRDFVHEAYTNAGLILNGFKPSAISDTNPFIGSATQTEGPLFGLNHALDMLARVSMSSQHLAWYQKWLVHRRARPEVFFARVQKRLTDPALPYPVHGELLTSPALNLTFNRFGSYLLPMATPSGSPLHPSFPSAHATMAGAAVTMLKAFYKGSYVIQYPKMPNADGTALVDYTGPELTVEGELNKLASNISLGRDFAGVHFRSDGDLGLVLGEELAISVLKELVNTYNEDFTGFRFNRFDGTPVVITKNQQAPWQ